MRTDDMDAERVAGVGRADDLGKALVSPPTIALAIAWNGTLPTLYGVPAALTCSSVSPTEAISGRQYVARGWAV